MKFTVSQIAALLEGTVEGDAHAEIQTVSAIEEAHPGSITFLSNPKYENHLYSTKATAVIINRDQAIERGVDCSLIRVEDSYLAFTRLLEEYDKILNYSKVGIEHPAHFGKGSSEGENIYRGAFSYIGDNVSIGNNVKIYPHAFIGDNCKIGDNSILFSGVKLYARTSLGSNCIIHSGAVIGSDGFGFAPQDDGTYKKIPQLGNVVIEDDVEIGANTTIDCATFKSTIIKQGAKIDNLVQVAHNVEIGENTVIASQSGISGSTKVGKNCVLAGQVGLAGHLIIADKVTIAAKTGIPNSVKEEGTIMFGNPAMKRMDYLKSHAVFRNLPSLNYRIKELEEKVLNLPVVQKKDEA
jgi:UDP-3-O-[3-hydroxymyristoyl] glucosamine N-acyltransferase